jgi:transglutaminase-like putative cysteine protease
MDRTRRTFLALASGFAAVAVLPRPGLAISVTQDVPALAKRIAPANGTTVATVRAMVDWTNQTLEWTATDYKSRDVVEILARGGGNCAEQAGVVRALLDAVGIRTRRIREINLQPASDRRGENARARVAEVGPRASVFGRAHNDHVWIEFWDAQQQQWRPADPTLALVGDDEWLRARVGFGARPTHAILPSRDMIVPVAIFAETDTPAGPRFEERSSRYLIDGFARIEPRVASHPMWASWTAEIELLQPLAQGAFEGLLDLHAAEALLETLGRTYGQMKGTA